MQKLDTGVSVIEIEKNNDPLNLNALASFNEFDPSIVDTDDDDFDDIDEDEQYHDGGDTDNTSNTKYNQEIALKDQQITQLKEKISNL